MRKISVLIIGAFLLILIGCGGSEGEKKCDSSNCDGCCKGNVCMTGSSDSSCGRGGVQCATCDIGFTCIHFFGTCECNGGPGCSCSKHSDCNNDACPNYGAACTYWEDQGVQTSTCKCKCTWGNECVSGCCWPVTDNSYSICDDDRYCKLPGQSCDKHYECDNNECALYGNWSDKTYCVDNICSCECTGNYDCNSNCCRHTTQDHYYFADSSKCE